MSAGNDLKLGRFGNQGSIDTTKLSNGGVRESSIDAKFKNIFTKFDTDGNHVLTDNEVQAAKEHIQSAAAHGRESIFSQKEAKKMMNQQGIQDTEAETLFEFLKALAQAHKDENGDVVSSKVDANGNAVVITQQGSKSIRTTYDKESQEPSTQVITEGDTEETYTYVEGKPVLTKKIENKGKANEKVTTITVDAQGNTVSTKVVEQTDEGSVETVTEDNKETVTKKDKSCKDVEIVITENKDDATKFKKTTTTFTENGKKEVIEDSTGKTEKEYIGDNRVITRKNGTTTDVTKKEDGKGATEVITKEGSDARTVNDLNEKNHRLSSKKTVNGKEYSLNYDGEGNITDVVVQFGENIDSICKKFGCTREELLEANKDIVKSTKSGRKYFDTGAKIKVPDKNYQIEADAKFLQNRDTSEQAIAKYHAWKAQRNAEDAEAAAREKSDTITFIENKYNTFKEMAIAHFKQDGVEKPTKRQIQLRAEQYKKLNPNLKDGQIKGNRVYVKYNADTTEGILERQDQRQIAREREAQQKAERIEARDGKSIAKAMYHAVDDNIGGLTEDEFKNALRKVNSKNVIGVIEQYRTVSPDEGLIEAIFDETYHTLGTRRDTAKKIIDSLVQRARTADLDERGRQAVDACVNELNSYWSLGIGVCDTSKLESLVDNLIGAIHAAESMTATERAKDKSGNGIEETLAIMGEQYDGNTAALNDQLAKDGWCADLYEGLKWCVGSDNLDEKVKADLDKYKGYIAQLQKAEKDGGEAGFKAKFKEIFGVEYDPKLIKGYNRMQQNFAMAQATTIARDGFKDEFLGVLGFSGDYEGDYGVLHRQYSNYLKQMGQGQIKDGNLAADNAIRIELQKEGIDFDKASAQDKKRALGRIVKNTYAKMEAEANKYTNGKTLDQMKKQLDNAGAAVFGTKHDIAFRVNDYIESQQQGGAAVGMALKAGAAITIAVATGGTGVPALLSAAALTTAASATIDLTDRVSSDVGLQDGEVMNILKNATVDGVSVFAGGMVGKYAMMFKSANAFVQAGGRLSAQMAGDLAVGAAAEYAQTGTITLEGVAFNAVFSAAGNLVSLRSLGKVDTPAPTPKTDPTPVTTKASSQGTAHQGTVRVGKPKANDIANEVQNALAKPDITAAELADLRKKVSAFSNRDLRKQLLTQIDAKGSILSGSESAAFKSAKKAQVKADADHVFEKPSALSDTDSRVLREHINLTDNVDELRSLRSQIEGKYGVTAEKNALIKEIDAKIKRLDADARPVSQKKDEVTQLLSEKRASGKGLNQDEFNQVMDYLQTITDKKDLDNIERLLSGRKMTLQNKKQLRQLLNEKRQTLHYTTEFEPAYTQRKITGQDIDDALGINNPEMRKMNDFYRDLETREFEPVYKRPKTDAQTIDSRLNPDNPELRALNERFGQGQSLLEQQARLEDAIFGLNIENATPDNISAIRKQIDVLGKTNPELKTTLNELLDEALDEINIENSSLLRENNYIETTHRQGSHVKSAEQSADAFMENLEYLNLERENLYFDRTHAHPSGKSAKESAEVFEQQLPIREKVEGTRAQLRQPHKISASDIDAPFSNPEIVLLNNQYRALETQEQQLKNQIATVKSQMRRKFQTSVEEIDSRMLAGNPELQAMNNRYKSLEIQEARIKAEVEKLKTQLSKKTGISADEIDARLTPDNPELDALNAQYRETEAIQQRARRELAQERAEEAAVRRENEYIDRTHNTRKSAKESAEVFEEQLKKLELEQREATIAEANRLLAELENRKIKINGVESDFLKDFDIKDLKEAINNNPELAAHLLKQMDDQALKYPPSKINEYCKASDLSVATFENYVNFHSEIAQMLPSGYNLSFDEMVAVLSKHHISDMENFTKYMADIDIEQIRKIGVLSNLISGSKEHYLMEFLSHHYNKGTTEFTPQTLTFHEDLGNYLQNNFLNIENMEDLLVCYPYTNRNIGSFPENWFKGIDASNRENISNQIQDVITQFSTNKWWDEGIEELQRGLSGALGKDVQVKYIGSGQFCCAYKISVPGCEPVVIKRYQQHSDNNAVTRGGLHGSKIEPQAGWFVSRNSDRTARFYCGRVEGVIDNDAYTITEFISSDSPTKLPGAVNNPNFEIKFGDAAAGNNIGGREVDFGAIFVNHSDGSPIKIELDTPRDKRHI